MNNNICYYITRKRALPTVETTNYQVAKGSSVVSNTLDNV